MKRFYIEEDDNGKEIKRKLTTFDNDDLTQLSDDDLLEAYYESTAEFYSKARKITRIEKEIETRNVYLTDYEDTLAFAGNNIIEAIEEVNN
ncbi:MAG: hypothetical protein L0J76_04565 [Tetragenococcus halophilus]|nr:hypothetical protein [Tetragenococcus halophilus]